MNPCTPTSPVVKSGDEIVNLRWQNRVVSAPVKSPKVHVLFTMAVFVSLLFPVTAKPRPVPTSTREPQCSFEEAYRNPTVTVLSTDCKISSGEALEALGVVLAGSVATGLADNLIAKALGASSKRILGWFSVFADLQTGSFYIQNPLRVYPVAVELKRSDPTVKTILFPVIRQWEAPLSAQTNGVGVLLAVDFLASAFSRHYWQEEWPIWLVVEYKNQPMKTKLLLSAAEVKQHIRKDRSHVLLLPSEDVLPVNSILAGCPESENGCGVAVTLVSGDPARLQSYRTNFELHLFED